MTPFIGMLVAFLVSFALLRRGLVPQSANERVTPRAGHGRQGQVR